MKYRGHVISDCSCGISDGRHAPDCQMELDAITVDELIYEQEIEKEKLCPECERANQFGEVCADCERNNVEALNERLENF